MSSLVIRFLFASSLGALACGCAVRPGLANAPQLGGAALADPRANDAIADGVDSCGRKPDPDPLRYRIPTCPRVSAPPAPPMRLARTGTEPIVMPWGEFFRARWRCPWLEQDPTDPTRALESIRHPAAVAYGIECRAIERASEP